jgi:hypothetical protein
MKGGTRRAVRTGACPTRTPKRIAMKDLLFVAVTAAFFALAWVYVKSFDHL